MGGAGNERNANIVTQIKIMFNCLKDLLASEKLLKKENELKFYCLGL